MLKKRSTFERLISLLQGASWALVLIGATSFFSLVHPFGILPALVAAFLGALPGLFFVVMFEIANLQVDKVYELRKQTELLEKLVKKQEDEKLSDN